MKHFNRAWVLGLCCLGCITITQADSAPTFLQVTISSANQAASASTVAKVSRILGEGIKHNLLTRYLVQTNTSGSFSGCVTVNPNTATSRTLSLEKQLQAAGNKRSNTTVRVEHTTSCETNSPKTDLGTPDDSGLIAFQTIDHSQHSGIKSARQVSINNQTDWQQLWSEHIDRLNPPPLPPSIDFSQQIVLGVFLGAHVTGCFDINIERVELIDNAKIVVSYAETTPQADSFCTQGTTAPSHLITINRSDLPVEFVKLSGPTAPPNYATPNYAIPFTTVLDSTMDSCPSLTDYKNLAVAKDQTNWQSLFWDQCPLRLYNPETGTRTIQHPPVPEVDFAHQMVVGITVAGGGCNIDANIESIENWGNEKLVINYRPVSSTPPPPGNSSSICTADFYWFRHWVTIPRSDLPIELHELPTLYIGSAD